MKKTLTCTFILLTSVSMAQELTKEQAANDVRQFISESKGIISGIKEGITEGRVEGESTDGAIIIRDQETFDKHLSFSVTQYKALSGNKMEVSIALKNSADKPVRLINLDHAQNVILIDKDGFASYLTSNFFSSKDDITIPANAGLRVKWTFSEVEETPSSLRIYGQSYPVQ